MPLPPPGASPGTAPGQPRPPAPPRTQAAAAHDLLICAAAPALAASGTDGQLRGQGLQGFYRSGVRTLARMELRLGGIEPMPLQGALTSAAEARFVGSVRIPGDPDPDPALTVERLRHADGTETVTVRNAGGRPPASRWRSPSVPTSACSATSRLASAAPTCRARSSRPTCAGRGTAAARPSRRAPPRTPSWLGAGVLRWDLEVQPGARWSVDLQAELESVPPGGRPPTGRGQGVPLPWSEPEVRCDDARAQRLVPASLDALAALLLADADRPTDLYAASGAPWRFGLTAADALWAARWTLPFGTRLAAGSLRALARRQHAGRHGGPGTATPSGAPAGAAAAGPGEGLIPGPMRHGGPELPPTCTATEATLLFVTVLAEAWRWGLPRHEVIELLPRWSGPWRRCAPPSPRDRTGPRASSSTSAVPRRSGRVAPRWPGARCRRRRTGPPCTAPSCSRPSPGPVRPSG
ncbi:glycogen debranching N-terminal domain-containing protein [Kitasatospora arboriphila]